MGAGHRAEFRLACPDPAAAEAVAAALAVEAQEGPDGSVTEVGAEGALVVVRIWAGDLAALRAAAHGAVRLVDAARRTLA